MGFQLGVHKMQVQVCHVLCLRNVLQILFEREALFWVIEKLVNANNWHSVLDIVGSY